jgi:hypothetical protein
MMRNVSLILLVYVTSGTAIGIDVFIDRRCFFSVIALPSLLYEEADPSRRHPSWIV